MTVPLIQSPALLAVPGLRHGLTTRAGGTSPAPYDALNLGLSTGDASERVHANRARVAATLGLSQVRFLKQVHGARIVASADLVGDDTRHAALPAADGWYVDQPGHLAAVLGADCPGVLIVDTARRALVLLHAGWRGTAEGIAGVGVARLVASGSRAQDLIAVVSVGISQAAYEVDTPVLEAMATACDLAPGDMGFAFAPTRPGHAMLDLGKVLVHQLTRAGLQSDRIHSIDGCTLGEPERFFSHRRDGPRAGRHALVAGWNE